MVSNFVLISSFFLLLVTNTANCASIDRVKDMSGKRKKHNSKLFYHTTGFEVEAPAAAAAAAFNTCVCVSLL